MGAGRQRGRGVGPGAGAGGNGAAEQRGAIVDLDRAVGFRRTGQGDLVRVDDYVAGNHGGDGCRGVNRNAQRRGGCAGIAGRVGGGGGQIMGAVGQRGRGVGPGAAAVGHGAAQKRRAVIDLDRAVGFRRAGQRQGVVVGDVVAHHAAVGRERGDARGNRGGGVDGDGERRRGRAGIAGRVGGGGGQVMGAVGQGGRGVGPGAAAVGHGAAEQRRAVIDLDRAVGFRRARQRQGVVVGDVVAHRAAVGRERGDARGNRGYGVNRHGQRRRGCAGDARYRIGCRKAVAAVAQGPGGKAPGAAGIGAAVPSSVAPS